MADEYTPEMIAMLERQVAYFRSDQLLLDRAAAWRTATPEECWAATVESCEDVEWMYAMMDPETRARALQPEPIPDHVLAALEAMQKR